MNDVIFVLTYLRMHYRLNRGRGLSSNALRGGSTGLNIRQFLVRICKHSKSGNCFLFRCERVESLVAANDKKQVTNKFKITQQTKWRAQSDDVVQIRKQFLLQHLSVSCQMPMFPLRYPVFLYPFTKFRLHTHYCDERNLTWWYLFGCRIGLNRSSCHFQTFQFDW